MKNAALLLFACLVLCTSSCLNQPKDNLINGNLAPNISIPDSSGKKVDLKSLQGNIVLVDFWASWCKPCRQENPYLVQVYDEFKDKEFQGAKSFIIYSVSLDSDKDHWLKAIQQDNLHWPLQLSELNGWKSSAVEAYKINAIPTNFMVDQNGTIIGRDMRSDDIYKLLTQRLKK